MDRVDRFLQRVAHDFTLGPPNRPSRERPAIVEPGARSRVGMRREIAAYVAALTIPMIVGALLIPLRADHQATAAIVLVVPVTLIAALGATGPAVVAALSAGVAYDLFLTEPYYRLVIDDVDDIVATVVLVLVGLVVGFLTSRLSRMTARAVARRGELQHLLEFSRATTQPLGADQLTDQACAHIAAVLGLRECRWVPGYHGTAAPVLLPDGNLMGFVDALNPDRARLPADLELPAIAGTDELGRFVLSSRPDHISSIEERLTAATIASLFANAIQPSHDRP